MRINLNSRRVITEVNFLLFGHDSGNISVNTKVVLIFFSKTV